MHTYKDLFLYTYENVINQINEGHNIFVNLGLTRYGANKDMIIKRRKDKYIIVEREFNKIVMEKILNENDLREIIYEIDPFSFSTMPKEHFGEIVYLNFKERKIL